MSSIQSLISCPNIQDTLLAGTGYNNNPLGNVNYLRFLYSDANRNNFLSKNINFRQNGLKTVELVFGQRFLENQVSDSGCIVCEDGIFDGTTSAVYDIDPCDGSSMSVTYTTESLMRQCQSNPQFIAGEIKKLMDAVIRKMETEATIYALANGGNFAKYVIDGGAPSNAPMNGSTKDAAGHISTNLEEVINFNSMANEYETKPWLFGGELLSNYMIALGAACCSDLGIDAGAYSRNSGLKMAYSDRITLYATDPNTVLSVVPGSTGILEYLEFDGVKDWGYNVIDDDALKQGVLMYPDPSLPIMFDFRAEYKCLEGTNTRQWTFTVAKPYAFWNLPDDMYQVGDQLYGVNGINIYKIVNP